ncbi:uncharacterized protein LOC143875647 [Tasmannia lanceolata]|uniref:uncharacterized protein LOC143875647 n=1 Tax=Tasmannia lanceolata TaxID=3420 RepID=UPI0040631B88
MLHNGPHRGPCERWTKSRSPVQIVQRLAQNCFGPKLFWPHKRAQTVFVRVLEKGFEKSFLEGFHSCRGILILHPDSKKVLLHIEEQILEYRDESKGLDQCSYFYDSSISNDGFKLDSSHIVQVESLSDQWRHHDGNNPFLEADRQETAKQEAAARRIHPTLHLPTISRPSTQVVGLFVS